MCYRMLFSMDALTRLDLITPVAQDRTGGSNSPPMAGSGGSHCVVCSCVGWLLPDVSEQSDGAPEMNRVEDAARTRYFVGRLDTLKLHFSYGMNGVETPHLEAAQGVVFEDVTVPGSWTWPVHASLFTDDLRASWGPSGAIDVQHAGLGSSSIGSDLG